MSFVGLSHPFGPRRRASRPRNDDGARGDTPLRTQSIASSASNRASSGPMSSGPTERRTSKRATSKEVR
jgi:hypothetical protein